MAETFSYSKLDQYRTCPRQYKFKYVERVSVRKEETVEAKVGQILHSQLRWLYDLVWQGKIPTREDTLIGYDEQWQKAAVSSLIVGSHHMTAEEYIKEGRVMLGKYYDENHPFDDGDTLALEKGLRFTLDVERDISLRGKIDRLARLDDGTVEITDYKTSKRMHTQPDLERDLQLSLYTLAVRSNWPDFTKVSVRLVYLRQGVTLRATITPETLEEKHHETLQLIREIHLAKKRDDFPTKEGPLCNWCAYKEICPARRHLLTLEDEVAVDDDALRAQGIAERFLELTKQTRADKSELDSLKIEMFEIAERMGVTALEGKQGRIKLTDRESGKFPARTKDKEAFLAVTALVKDVGIDLFESYADLNLTSLYKALESEELPTELREHLQEYVVNERSRRASAIYHKPTATEDDSG